MTTNPFRWARGYLSAAPRAKWAAIFASLLSAVLLVSLLPLIYFGLDHLIWKGKIPSYDSLTPSRQEAFRAEWNATVSDAEEKASPAGWEARWQATVHKKLHDHVGAEAAASYRKEDGTLTGNNLGLLSLVSRERSEWGTKALSWLARELPWTWRPDAANNNYLTGLFLAAVIILLLHGLCMLAADYCAAEASIEVGTRIRRTFYSHATRLSPLTMREENAVEAGELFTGKIEAIQDGIRAWLRANVTAPVTALLLITLLLAVNPGLTLCFILAGLLVWLVLGQTAAKFSREGRLAARRSEARMAQMRESVHLMQMVKSYLMDRFSQTRLERQLTEYSRAEWRRLRGQALSRPALSSAVALVTVGVLYLAGRSVLFGQLSVAGLAMKVVAIVFLVMAMRAWIAGRVRMRKASEAAAAVAEFLDRRTDPGQAIDAEFLQPLRKRLEVVEASVREPGSGKMLLDGISFAVPAGKRIAVVASSHEEGRTLLSLFGRFQDTTGGEIRIDGKNIRWVTLESLRTQVSIISQPLTVFTDTVANNIGCGDPGFNMPQVIDAAKLSHAHHFVQRLPYGYETVIGAGGFSLRPGEKLRIALARALLRDPSLLVIEEPGEAMDLDSQTLLDDTMERAKEGRTMLFLTRRERMLLHADHVLLLHQGQILVEGSHEALMRTSELYRRLVFKELA